MKKIILITGGQRSGKSSYAEQLALKLTSSPIYLATARIWDDEFRHRIELHQSRRGEQWRNIEEEKRLSLVDVEQAVVVIDCVTLWATNFFFDLQSKIGISEENHVSETLEELRQEFARFTAQEATFIFVTNEIGEGGVSENRVQRKFTDVLGWFNQHLAAAADEVILMVSGIPLKVK